MDDNEALRALSVAVTASRFAKKHFARDLRRLPLLFAPFIRPRRRSQTSQAEPHLDGFFLVVSHSFSVSVAVGICAIPIARFCFIPWLCVTTCVTQLEVLRSGGARDKLHRCQSLKIEKFNIKWYNILAYCTSYFLLCTFIFNL